MIPSVVIIAKNKAENITDCIQSAQLVSSDIIVVDSGSTDNTASIASALGAKVINVRWESYGAARNAGAHTALHDWILALDADERITQELADSIYRIDEQNTKFIYGFKRGNFLAKKRIKFGQWGKNSVYRLYYRYNTSWDLLPVHEALLSKQLTKKIIKGDLIHFTINSIKEYQERTMLYANLNAQKYFRQGRKAGFIKRFLSPVFNFFQFYILRLGFLDGKEGFFIAKTTAYYTWLKYYYLHQMLSTSIPEVRNGDISIKYQVSSIK
jgi:glycosyltransferase involved in cell wall biosynthesis